MFGVKKKFIFLSGKHRLLIALVGALVITIPAVVYSACGAGCADVNVFNRMVSGELEHFAVVKRLSSQFSNCYRLYVTEDSEGPLPDTTDSETWRYIRWYDATTECQTALGIDGASLAGETIYGPLKNLTCYKECVLVEEEEEE